MKPASTQFQNQLQRSVLTLRRLWRLTPAGRGTLYYTDHDREIVYDSNTYVSEKTFTASAISNQLGIGQANFEITTLLTEDITKADVEGGIYGGAKVEVDAIFYDHTDYGVMPMFTGAITTASVPYKFQAIFGCNGVASRGQHYLTEVYSPTCRAEFCDERCSLDIADFTTAGCEVTAVAGIHTFNSSDIDTGLNAYALGYVKWLTGANAGRRSEVQSSSGTSVRLLIKPPFQIEVGDTFDIVKGCDKQVTTCTAYDNLLNFRGEPYVPGSDYIKAPTKKIVPPGPATPPTSLPEGTYFG